MITKVKIENFRALKSVSVQLRPLTVLLGLNDSGKTSFLEAIYRRVRNSFEQHDRWLGRPQPPDVLLKTGQGSFGGTVELFQLPSQGIPMQSQGVADQPGGAPQLHVTGANLAAFLDYLLRKDRKRFDQIQQALRERIPGLEEISITTPSPAERALTLTIEGGFQLAGIHLSTGARMMFFFVALAYHPNPPDVVLIEEPENGVHPKRLKDIVELLRGMTEGRLSDRKTQIILTTHSPYLLDHIRPPHDQVLVFQREADGRRNATEVDETRLKAFLDEFMLGEVWFNRGEEGLVATSR